MDGQGDQLYEFLSWQNLMVGWAIQLTENGEYFSVDSQYWLKSRQVNAAI